MKTIAFKLRKPGSQLHKQRGKRAYNFRVTLPKEMVDQCHIQEGTEIHQRRDGQHVRFEPVQHPTPTSHPVAVNTVTMKGRKYPQYKVEIDKFYKKDLPEVLTGRAIWDDEYGATWHIELDLQ